MPNANKNVPRPRKKNSYSVPVPTASEDGLERRDDRDLGGEDELAALPLQRDHARDGDGEQGGVDERQLTLGQNLPIARR